MYPPAAYPQAQNPVHGFPNPIPAAPVSPQQLNEESPSFQWPDGDVKLECTKGREPEGWDDQGWMWRSSGARKRGLPEGAYKSDKRVCLGVFHCACSTDAGHHKRLFRPRKEKDARDKQRGETCHICHKKLTYVSCSASLTYYLYMDQDGVEHSVRQHEGWHEHSRPPIKVLPAAQRAALDRQVRENPTLTPQQLRAGAGSTQVALGDINPILLGARKARAEVEKSKVRQGIIAPAATRNSGFQLLDSLDSLQEAFETPWIVKSDLMDGRFIVMQTPFMRDVHYPGHENPVLSSIFDAALPTVAKILADWRNRNRVVEAFNDCISGSRGIDMHRKPTLFLEAFGLIPTPELEAVLFDPLSRLMRPHPELENLAEDECNRRVMGVGSALFQLLAIQHELGEPLNLNGDLISDLWEQSVVPVRMDGTAALTAMFGSMGLEVDTPVDQQMLRFNREHTVYDRDYRPPSFKRELPSINPPRAPIAVVLPGRLKRAGSPLSEDEKPPKRQRKKKTDDDMEAEGVKKRQPKKKGTGDKRRAKTPPVNTGRKLRSGNVI
ncbi:hypothetical protein C8R47DRAFT_1210419 [Mycena vitilis]|nr:hypothetical protein C8R47DRAFT_1210419 [Mycena vitilis]